MDVGPDHGAACFREYGEDHEYWDSEPIADDEAARDRRGEDSASSEAAGD